MVAAKPPRFKPINAKAEAELIKALLSLRDADECKRFLYDVCTPKEIGDLCDRWWIARLLDEGKLSYREMHALTGVSVTTIGRVARFLQQELFQGYRLVLDRAKSGNKKK
ncbi:MAG: YerC/YecD family TrpR-related protein [Alphaproteobacteria bacterium]|nr:YerC/YecD family TrpR-related protein [Alphaproteobacteria bacterium]